MAVEIVCVLKGTLRYQCGLCRVFRMDHSCLVLNGAQGNRIGLVDKVMDISLTSPARVAGSLTTLRTVLTKRDTVVVRFYLIP